MARHEIFKGAARLLASRRRMADNVPLFPPSVRGITEAIAHRVVSIDLGHEAPAAKLQRKIDTLTALQDNLAAFIRLTAAPRLDHRGHDDDEAAIDDFIRSLLRREWEAQIDARIVAHEARVDALQGDDD